MYLFSSTIFGAQVSLGQHWDKFEDGKMGGIDLFFKVTHLGGAIVIKFLHIYEIFCTYEITNFGLCNFRGAMGRLGNISMISVKAES